MRAWITFGFLALAAGARAEPSEAPVAEGAETAAHPVGSPPPPSVTGSGFAFGSYGRIGVGSDLRGHSGYGVNVVSHGSRLEIPPYLELDLYYGGTVLDGRWRAVIAPAFGGDLFHYTGSFASRFALRNAYVETEDIGLHGLRVWAGSRMYRGDDVYLFDYWPLDNLNTVGGGVGLSRGDNDFALHGGQSRLDDPFQLQVQAAPSRGVGPPVSALVVNRPRFVGTAKYTRSFHRGAAGAKLSLYAELHAVPEGEQPIREQERSQKLPADYGWTAGAQLGGWLRPFTFVNLFFRYAGGLAAFGDLSSPTGFDAQRKTTSARELVFAFSLNVESRRVGVMAGAYLRSFSDPGSDPFNPRSYVEGIVAARPHLYLTRWLHVAAELSYQGRSYAGYDPWLDRRLSPKVFRASVMPIVSPLGPGTYSRPQIYAVYTYSALDRDALDALFDPTDVRSPNGNVHYLGVGAEWWFRSSYR